MLSFLDEESLTLTLAALSVPEIIESAAVCSHFRRLRTTALVFWVEARRTAAARASKPLSVDAHSDILVGELLDVLSPMDIIKASHFLFGRDVGCENFTGVKEYLMKTIASLSPADAMAAVRRFFRPPGFAGEVVGRLVAIAIVQAQTAHTAPGKIAALWMPITTFVALGLEHRYAKLTHSSG